MVKVIKGLSILGLWICIVVIIAQNHYQKPQAVQTDLPPNQLALQFDAYLKGKLKLLNDQCREVDAKIAEFHRLLHEDTAPDKLHSAVVLPKELQERFKQFELDLKDLRSKNDSQGKHITDLDLMYWPLSNKVTGFNSITVILDERVTKLDQWAAAIVEFLNRHSIPTKSSCAKGNCPIGVK